MTTDATWKLDDLQIARPCSVDWNKMTGDDRVRFCGQCKLNVYNLSEMTRQDAEKLVISKEGNLCAKFFRRKDGTIITQDCPLADRLLLGGEKLARNSGFLIIALLSTICTVAVGHDYISSYLNNALNAFCQTMVNRLNSLSGGCAASS